jgi:PPOX class probable F420-dependent enzyme
MTALRTPPEQQSTLIPAGYHALLRGRCYAHAATLRADGLLSVHPVAILFDGERMRFSTLKSRGKFRNLSRDPRLSLSIIDPENPLRHLELRGRASWEDDAGRVFIDAIARHYFDRDTYPYDRPGAERVTVTLHIEQIAGPGVTVSTRDRVPQPPHSGA